MLLIKGRINKDIRAKFSSDISVRQTRNRSTANNFHSPYTVGFGITATPQAGILFTATLLKKISNTATPQTPMLGSITRFGHHYSDSRAKIQLGEGAESRCQRWKLLWGLGACFPRNPPPPPLTLPSLHFITEQL